jgi:hypothetical protein
MVGKQDGFGHEKPFEGQTNDWITPKWIIDAFGEGYFDLDPCASVTQPWKCAKESFNVKTNGFSKKWFGNVWLNPPYGPYTISWIEKLSRHGAGIALIYARIETKTWQEVIFRNADGFLFPKRRIAFYKPNGVLPGGSSGAPSALVAFGTRNKDKLKELCVSGKVVGAFLGNAVCTSPNIDTHSVKVSLELCKET